MLRLPPILIDTLILSFSSVSPEGKVNSSIR